MPSLRTIRTRVTSVLLLAATAFLIACQQGILGSSPAAPFRDTTANAHATLELGVTTGPLARNWWRPWTKTDLRTVDEFERDAGKPAKLIMWYADWQHNKTPLRSQLNAVARRGGTPEITWEPWDASKGLYRPQPRYRLSNIIAGRFNPYIRTWAHALAAWHHPVVLRFAQEMDGNWFPWADYANGNHPGQFIHAWRHVHHIFQQAGATNVKWVWSPAFTSPQTFPGTNEVNIIATTCQNAGKRLFARGWQPFAKGCGKQIARLHALAPHLPIQLAEASSAQAGGNKAHWITGMFSYLAHHPKVSSLVWFNLAKEADWRIESSPSAQRAFATGARSPRII